MKHFLHTTFKKATLLIYCSLGSLIATAQVPAIQWDKTIGGGLLEQLLFLEQTNDGGYISGGRSNSNVGGDKSQMTFGNDDFWIVKQNANGNKIWDKTFGGSAADRINYLHQTTDGGYILGGTSSSGISGNKTQASRGNADFWIVKTDANGNKIWDKTFGGTGNEDLFSIRQTNDGGFILGGRSDSPVSGEKSQPSKGNNDYWIVKIDGQGIIQWDKTLGGSNIDDLFALQQTSDGGYIFGGTSYSVLSGDRTQPTRGGADFWIVKLDALGVKQWDKAFGGNGNDHLYFLQQISTGGFILGGESDSNISSDKSEVSQGMADFWIVKVDNNGNKIWDKSFGGNNEDILYSLDQTSDSGYILGGLSASGITGDKSQINLGIQDFWVIKIDANGNKLWDKTLGGNGNDVLTSLQQTADNGYILGGFSNTGINNDKTEPSKGGVDFWIVKLGPDLINNTTDLTNSTKLSILPNPTHSNFTLQLTTNQPATATLISTLGQQIETRTLQPNSGNITEQFSTKNLAKGIYNLSITSNQSKTVKKIVVQ